MQNSVSGILMQIKTDIQKQLEENYLDKPNSEDIIRDVTDYIKNFLYQVLVDVDDRLHYEDLMWSNSNIKFEVMGYYSGEILVTPDNFFTGLLMRGIVAPSVIHGGTEYENETGRYKWTDNGLVFQPKVPVESIEVNITLKP